MHDATTEITAWVERISRRADGLDDVVPADHRPNWQDRPSRSRLYPDVPGLPLLSPLQLGRAYQSAVANATPGLPSLDSISVLLYLLIGPLSRRLEINWNNIPPPLSFAKQEFKRGTASGGGLYPIQLYVVVAGDAAPGAGVYHYCNARHQLVPVRNGEWAPALSEAASLPLHPYYLVISADFWMNCFKYHNFGYHVCGQDAGAALGALQMACDAMHIEHRSTVAFHDQAVNAVIGANPDEESALAVVSLGPPLNSARPSLQALGAPPTAPRHWQRSKRVDVPKEFLAIHRCTLLDQPPGTPMPAFGHRVPNTALETKIARSLPSVLVARRSAWSSMRGPGPLEAGELCELLRFVSARAKQASAREYLPEGSLEFALRTRDVKGLMPGLYAWNQCFEKLEPLSSSDTAVWQTTYSMDNYNLDEAAAILFIIGRLGLVTEAYGARGYRLLNACAGSAAQLTYTAAAALKLDCGVVLGVRAQHVKSILQLSSDQNVLLAAYLSPAQPRAELFSFHLLPDVPTWKPA